MKRVLKPAAFALAFALGAWPGASMGGPAAADPPRLVAFSPAAVHAGDAFLIDAEFSGSRIPRVWIGERPLPRRSVRATRASGAPGVRRIWARMPARVPAGDHVLKIGTRAGKSVAAKPIKVASCNPEPIHPAGCGNIPDSGAELRVTGAMGYSRVLRQSSSLQPDVLFGQSNLDLFINQNLDFNVTILLEPAAMHVGDVPTLQMVFMAGPGKYWQRYYGTVRVVEESASRVGICIDVTLVNELPELLGPDEPAVVTVKGHLVMAR